MKSQCLPFSQIPHSTRLFTDFLSYTAPVRRFYPRSPRFTDWMQEEAAALKYDATRREQVATILERQNQAWGASPKTLENITRLREGACASVTGQQVGLFGGPLFSIFKALTAVKLAEQASRAGVPCVPVFWLATEDHDLVEVNHVGIPGQDGVLQSLSVPTQSIPDAPVGTVTFGPEIEAVVEKAAELFGNPEVSTVVREAYRAGETFGSALGRLFAHLFADWGVILLDAADAGLHQLAEPVYRAAIEHAAELDDRLLARGKELEAAGYHQQVKVTTSSTLLFALQSGSRVPIHRRPNGSASQFAIAEEKLAQPELLRQIAAEPQNFSPNVLLRPVVQDYLLPTLAYTGGAAENAYFAQAGVVYEALLGRVTPVLPRFSATLIEAKPQALLERYGLGLTDFFQGADHVRQILGERTLSSELQRAFEQGDAAVEKSLGVIRESLAKLDKTLVESATHAEEKMRYQLTQLRSRAARAELRQGEILSRHAALLGNTLFPNKTLQEREIAGIYFIARHGVGLLHQLYEFIHVDCLDHQVISL